VGHAHRALFSRIFPPLLVDIVAVSRFLRFRLIQLDDKLVLEKTSEAQLDPGEAGDNNTSILIVKITRCVPEAIISFADPVLYSDNINPSYFYPDANLNQEDPK
jgi:hypothetical protein